MTDLRHNTPRASLVTKTQLKTETDDVEVQTDVIDFENFEVDIAKAATVVKEDENVVLERKQLRRKEFEQLQIDKKTLKMKNDHSEQQITQVKI